jgi:hypothetical protein
VLNSPRRIDVSGLDLSGAGANERTLEAALQVLRDGGSILVAGRNRSAPDQGPASAGIDLVAFQFYLRAGAARPGG